MPEALVSRRGSLLNCRFAVNGIQYASREVSFASARAGSFAARVAGSKSLYTVVSLRCPQRHGARCPGHPERLNDVDVAGVERDAKPSVRTFTIRFSDFASRNATVLRCDIISHGKKLCF